MNKLPPSKQSDLSFTIRAAILILLLFSSSLFSSSLFSEWTSGKWTLIKSASAQTVQQSNSLFIPIVIDSQSTSDVYISEFMASNTETLKDEDSTSPDWIEIHNPLSTPVNLNGWSLTDDETDLSRWRFPAVVLQPDEYLVVMASGKDRAVLGQELHTNFKLDREGEYLALVHPDGYTVASFYKQYGQQYEDRSFGITAVDFQKDLLADSTPGGVNSTKFVQSDLLVDVYHEPNTPAFGETLKVVAKLTPLAQSMPTNVTLIYRIMYEDEVQIPMRDDGTDGDTTAGDGIYIATIAGDTLATLANPGEMIRYSVTARTADGVDHRYPLALSPTGFAEYYGTIIQNIEIKNASIEGAESENKQPVLHWFSEKSNRAYTREGTRASLYFDGVLYENIWVHIRGGVSVGYPKKGLKFRFNRSQPFTIKVPEKAVGQPDASGDGEFELTVKEFNLSTTYSDKTYIRQVLAFDAYRDAGVASPISFPVRIEQNGEFHMVSIFIEQPDESFLARNNIDPDGALYKMFNPLLPQRIDKVEKKTRKHEGNEDLLAFATGITNIKGDALAQFMANNLDLPQVINYLAQSNVIQQSDHLTHNYYLYRDSDNTGLWSILPWDQDFTFGRSLIIEEEPGDDGRRDLVYLQDKIWATDESTAHPLYGGFEQTLHQSGNYLYDAILRTPQTRELYLRRLRTLMDQFWQPPETPVAERYFETRLDRFYHAGFAADIALDAARWPVTWGTPQAFPEAITLLKQDYFDVRRAYMYGTYMAEVGGIVPLPQSDDSAVTFGSFRFNENSMVTANTVANTSVDPSQDVDREFEFFTLVNSAPYAVDLSGWQVTQHDPLYSINAGGTSEHAVENESDTIGVSIILAPGTVIPANGTLCVPANAATYHRTRTNFLGGQNATGQSSSNLEQDEIRCLGTNSYRGSLSSRAGVVMLRNSANQPVDRASYVEASPHMDQLIISELNYKPALDTDGQKGKYEFLELTNIGTKAIDVEGFRFTAGIDYIFPENSTLAPNQSIVIVEDNTEFNRRYANTAYAPKSVLGTYQGKLRDRGETLTLVDQSGQLVTRLRYKDGLHSSTGLPEAESYTLNRRSPWLGDHIACSWTASSDPLGTPGVHDAATGAFVCRSAAYLPFIIEP